ncbi:Protein TED1 [Escovopsis weberi]|uniref:Protein TED1 n=1 Tax=Escovopsis weberi TaxID=150374 RepID=A0A0M9VUS7_ESCWE|nr:Protein TED1 [Escovopsis weberi]
MSVAAFLRNGLRLLIPLALASTVLLYLYPLFGRCAFPLPSRDVDAAFEATKALHWPLDRGLDALSRQVLQSVVGGHSEGDQPASPPPPPTKLAPFRLLVLADPQLEGDTSIPTNLLGTFPHVKSIVRHLTWQTQHWCFRERLRQVAHDLVDICFEDIPYLLMSLHKRFDLVGNDFFLAHIYRTLHWWTRPTHVTVLGDLLGSQWIGDDEFQRRSSRYWDRAFRGGERVPDDAASWPEHDYGLAGVLRDEFDPDNVWARRLINVAGNHDIGYAGDLTPELLERYERVFGKANYELRFGAPANASRRRDADYMRVEPEVRIVVLNDMNLDAPAKDTSLQDATYHFLNTVIATSALVEQEGVFTLVLTHIPLHKPQGLCVDAPFFDFHGADDGSGVKEQNMLSPDASKGFLEGIYGMSADPLAAAGGLGRKGLILNGHDHEGCDTYHFVNQTNGTSAAERSWEVARWADAQARGLPALTTAGLPGRREITVRSMMGGFGGNAGLLSLWFDEERWEWEHEFVTCPLGTQHMWWFTHFLDAGVLLVILLYGVVSFLTAVEGRRLIDILFSYSDFDIKTVLQDSVKGIATTLRLDPIDATMAIMLLRVILIATAALASAIPAPSGTVPFKHPIPFKYHGAFNGLLLVPSNTTMAPTPTWTPPNLPICQKGALCDCSRIKDPNSEE